MTEEQELPSHLKVLIKLYALLYNLQDLRNIKVTFQITKDSTKQVYLQEPSWLIAMTVIAEGYPAITVVSKDETLAIKAAINQLQKQIKDNYEKSLAYKV